MELRDVALSSLVPSSPCSFAALATYTEGLLLHTPADAGRSKLACPSRTLRVFSTADVGRFARRCRATSAIPPSFQLIFERSFKKMKIPKNAKKEVLLFSRQDVVQEPRSVRMVLQSMSAKSMDRINGMARTDAVAAFKACCGSTKYTEVCLYLS